MKNKKKSISSIAITIILVLLITITVIITWNVFRGFIRKSIKSAENSCSTLNLEIEKAEIDIKSNTLYIQVKRNSGKGNLSVIRFVITNSSESVIRDKNISLQELEKRTFSFNDVGNVSFINKIEIAGIISYNNEKKVCGIASSRENFEVYSSILCTPKTCLELGCGIWDDGCGNQINCGDCEEVYCGNKICNSGETYSSCPSDCSISLPKINFEPITINKLIGTFWTTTTDEVNRLKNIGGSWSKPIFFWRAYENNKDSYLSQFDGYISLIKNSNLQAIITISGGNVPQNQDCLNKKHYLSDNSACSQEEFNTAVENFVRFAEIAVSRYNQDVKIFQIMIEPNTAETYKIDFEPEVFAEIMYKTYPRLKDICPECVFYPGGEAVDTTITYTNTWLYKMHSYSQLTYGKVYADLVAVHPFLIYEKPEENLLEIYNIYKQIGENFNINYNNKLYVFADEFAFYTSCLGGGDPNNEYPVGRWPSNPAEAEDLQAKYWTRAILLTLSTDYVPRLLWPPGVLDSDSTKCCVQAMCNMGVCSECLDVYWDNSAAYFSNTQIKKSGQMVKSLTDVLKSYTFSRNLIEGAQGNYAIEFNKSGKKLIVVWNINGETNINLSPYLSTSNVKITHLITEQTETYPSNSVPISDTPVFAEEV